MAPRVLPAGWEATCTERALRAAGFTYTERIADSGRPYLSFNYGPTPAESIWMTAESTAGALRLVASRLREPTAPSLADYIAANDVTIEWSFGKLYWTERELHAAVSLFAYPDRVPAAEDVQVAVHELWQQRSVLSQLQVPTTPIMPTGLSWRELGERMANATGLQWRVHGDACVCSMTCDGVRVGLRLSQDHAATLVFDVVAIDAAPWPDDLHAWQRLHLVTSRLMRGAATRWNGGQVVVREPWPWPLTATDHPEWAGLMLDHAVSAAELVLKEHPARR